MSKILKEKFITGNQAVIEAAKIAGAKILCGYPITPATEILEIWANEAVKDKELKIIQAEDETAAGFNVIGALFAKVMAFTATAGPGHILMQDPLSMAEAMRLPFVNIVMQRGGPSTGTVIYSQQEVTLAIYGGNGEGHRIVYSTSDPQDLFDYTMKAFNIAWNYRFPVTILGDGYQSKMSSLVNMNFEKYKGVKPYDLFPKSVKNLRNCFNFEYQLAENVVKNQKDFIKVIPKVVESEELYTKDAQIVLVAHGIVANAAKEAINKLREKNKKVGLFRPITLNPIDFVKLSKIASYVKEIIILESSLGHLERIIKSGLYGLTKIRTYKKPVEAISPEEIINFI